MQTNSSDAHWTQLNAYFSYQYWMHPVKCTILLMQPVVAWNTEFIAIPIKPDISRQKAQDNKLNSSAQLCCKQYSQVGRYQMRNWKGQKAGLYSFLFCLYAAACKWSGPENAFGATFERMLRPPTLHPPPLHQLLHFRLGENKCQAMTSRAFSKPSRVG